MPKRPFALASGQLGHLQVLGRTVCLVGSSASGNKPGKVNEKRHSSLLICRNESTLLGRPCPVCVSGDNAARDELVLWFHT